MTKLTQEELKEQLFDAVRRENLQAVKNYLSNGAYVNDRDEHGYTALHFAASWGLTEIARVLIEKGASLNARTKIGLTPLHYAASGRHKELGDLLIDHGGRL